MVLDVGTSPSLTDNTACSSVLLIDTPTYVVYHELILTSKEYMTQVTAVDAYWLAELGSVFYSVREKNFDPSNATSAAASTPGARKRADKEFSRRAELEMEMAKEREERDRREKEEKEAKKTGARRAGAIAVPGTPMTGGMGSRAGMTPRRRVGL